MNIQDLATLVSEEARTTKTQAQVVVKDLFDKIGEALARGEEVRIPSFGTFVVKERKERKGRNPFNGEEITIEASKTVSFKASKHLKEQVK